jgi:hypothetical protein
MFESNRGTGIPLLRRICLETLTKIHLEGRRRSNLGATGNRLWFAKGAPCMPRSPEVARAEKD